jgi:DNA polymerase-3 subunit epsilon
VLDVETTGVLPDEDALVEIAAVTYCNWERLCTLQALIDPGRPLPLRTTTLTGITPGMLGKAPTIDVVLPAFVDLARDSVLVGHNIGFDLEFLDAALVRDGRRSIANDRIDTLALSHALLSRETVPNFSLDGLFGALGLAHRPTHRALPDVLATADLFRHLVEIGAARGLGRASEFVQLSQTGRLLSAQYGHGQNRRSSRPRAEMVLPTPTGQKE